MVRKQSLIASGRLPKPIDPDHLGERQAKVVIDQVKRSSSRNRIRFDMQAQLFSFREPITTRPSYMALTIGPICQP